MSRDLCPDIHPRPAVLLNARLFPVHATRFQDRLYISLCILYFAIPFPHSNHCIGSSGSLPFMISKWRVDR